MLGLGQKADCRGWERKLGLALVVVAAASLVLLCCTLVRLSQVPSAELFAAANIPFCPLMLAPLVVLSMVARRLRGRGGRGAS